MRALAAQLPATDEDLHRLIESLVVSADEAGMTALMFAMVAGGRNIESRLLTGALPLATRKLKMARLLADGGLPDEARPPLLDAALALSRALAVETRVPEPGTLDDILSPPLAAAWGRHAIVIRDFLAVPDVNCDQAVRAMEELTGVPDDCPF